MFAARYGLSIQIQYYSWNFQQKEIFALNFSDKFNKIHFAESTALLEIWSNGMTGFIFNNSFTHERTSYESTYLVSNTERYNELLNYIDTNM